MRLLPLLVLLGVLVGAGFGIWVRAERAGQAALAQEAAPEAVPEAPLGLPDDPPAAPPAASPVGPPAAPPPRDPPPEDGAADDPPPPPPGPQLSTEAYDAAVAVTDLELPACPLGLPCHQSVVTGDLAFPVHARAVDVRLFAWWNGTGEAPALEIALVDADGAVRAQARAYPPVVLDVDAPFGGSPWRATVGTAGARSVAVSGDVHLRAVVTRAT